MANRTICLIQNQLSRKVKITLSLFYNSQDGSGAIANVTRDAVTTTKVYPDHSFGDWTHLVSQEKPFSSISSATVVDPVGGFPGTIAPPKEIIVDSVVLFYNARSGTGALGVLDKNELTVTKGFKEGSFGTWTAISDPSTAIDPQDLGYKLIRTGSGVRIMNYDSTFTDVDIANSDLSPEQQQAAIDQIYEKMEAFIKRNADAIANSHIKAEDIGGELYGIASGVIVAIFAPFAGVPLLDELIAKPFEDTLNSVVDVAGDALKLGADAAAAAADFVSHLPSMIF